MIVHAEMNAPWNRLPLSWAVGYTGSEQSMKIKLAYGRGSLPVELPGEQTTVITPTHSAGLKEERAAVFEALEHPIGARALREWIKPGDRVCISFSDITRATPNDRLIPWILEYLAGGPGVPAARRDGSPYLSELILVNQTGSHRPNTQAELETMLTPAVAGRRRVVNHEPENLAAHVQVGTMRDGTPAWINRHVVEADVRIVTGFIEPHFFAGFSGGVKGIIPGTAALPSIRSNHGFKNIGDPNATFGLTVGNPLWEELRDVALRVGPTFLLNVTLNEAREITGVFAGDLVQAHQAGCAFAKQAAMQPVPAPFDIVVTSNSGYPLDLNLYQGVKGMSTGARIVKPGGTVILACECCEGVPARSPYEKMLRGAASPAAILERLARSSTVEAEQWQAQIQALVQRQAEVLVYSSLPDETLRACHLIPCHEIEAAVRARLARLEPDARVAVLPYGPVTIPYLAC
jgi:nickel-dependent lactate racemase